MAVASRPGDEAQELFVPGRVCLFGEHSDWAGSFTRFNADITPGVTIVCGTNQGLYARVRRHPSLLILTTTTDKGEVLGPYELDMDPKMLLKVAQEGGFWSYAAGVAYKICVDYRVGGLEINNYRTDLPLRKGLSSSAAFCVLLARAFNRLYDMKMTIRGEMEYAYQGELTTPSRCGRMDQGCAYGDRAIVMRYDGEFVGVEALSLRGPPLHYVVVDLAGSKSTTEILAGLQAGYPFPRDDTAKGVHELLGPLNKEVCEEAAAHLEAGRAEDLGRLMNLAQQRWDDLAVPACPSQLTAPLLHKVLQHPELQRHIWGGKGVGSQGDGTAQLLARSKADQERVRDIVKEAFGMDSLSLTLAPSSGVRKAVIPAAGFSPSLYPAAKTVKTELFPVVCANGWAKPAILHHVEEVVGAGVEEVVVVVQKEDLPLFERLFYQPESQENFNLLSAAAQAESRKVRELGRRVKLVVQSTQEGFGHAIYCAREAIGDEPFLLLIGHHIYKSTGSVSVPEQLIRAYTRHQCAVVSLQQSRIDDVHQFGTASGVWVRESEEDTGVLPAAYTDLVAQLLGNLGLEQYAEAFSAEKLLYSQLPQVTNEELKEMGIPLGPRKRLLAAFAEIDVGGADVASLPSKLKRQSDAAELPSVLRITTIREKPTREYAMKNLLMSNPSLPPDTFLTAFGQYVLTPQIFQVLEDNISQNIRQQGAFQLTDALDNLRKDQGLVGVCVEGKRYNIGSPASYVASLAQMQEEL